MTDTIKKTYQFNEKSIHLALPEIAKLAPELTSIVKGSKTDSYEYFLSSEDGKTFAHWNRKFEESKTANGKCIGSYMILKTFSKIILDPDKKSDKVSA